MPSENVLSSYVPQIVSILKTGGHPLQEPYKTDFFRVFVKAFNQNGFAGSLESVKNDIKKELEATEATANTKMLMENLDEWVTCLINYWDEWCYFCNRVLVPEINVYKDVPKQHTANNDKRLKKINT